MKERFQFTEPFFEMHGNRELLIEGRGVLTEYSSKLIAVALRRCTVTIEGEGLGLGAMNEERLSIIGRILNIRYEEK